MVYFIAGTVFLFVVTSYTNPDVVVLLWSCCGLTIDRLAQLVEHQTAVQEVAGSNLGRTNTQGL